MEKEGMEEYYVFTVLFFGLVTAYYMFTKYVSADKVMVQ